MSGIIVEQLINPLKPCDAVALSSASASLWNNRPLVLLEELQQDHNAAAALAAKAGISRSDLRRAPLANWQRWAQALSTDDMQTLGELSSLLVELEVARINYEDRAGVQQLAVGLELAGAAALPRLHCRRRLHWRLQQRGLQHCCLDRRCQGRGVGAPVGSGVGTRRAQEAAVEDQRYGLRAIARTWWGATASQRCLGVSAAEGHAGDVGRGRRQGMVGRTLVGGA